MFFCVSKPNKTTKQAKRLALCTADVILRCRFAAEPRYETFPASVMNLSAVLSFLPATTPLLLFHIPLLIFLIQSYLLPSIQPLPFPLSLSFSLSFSFSPSHHLFLTILLRTLPPRGHFLLVSLSPLLFVSQTEYQGAARMGYRLCVCVQQALFARVFT